MQHKPIFVSLTKRRGSINHNSPFTKKIQSSPLQNDLRHGFTIPKWHGAKFIKVYGSFSTKSRKRTWLRYHKKTWLCCYKKKKKKKKSYSFAFDDQVPIGGLRHFCQYIYCAHSFYIQSTLLVFFANYAHPH